MRAIDIVASGDDARKLIRSVVSLVMKRVSRLPIEFVLRTLQMRTLTSISAAALVAEYGLVGSSVACSPLASPVP